MAASVVGSARTPSNGTDATGASLALTIPAGTAIDDYAVIIVELWDSTATNPTLTYPSGFTQIVNYVSTTDGFQKLKVALKKLTAADSGTYSVSGFASHFRQGHVVILRGIDLTTALDVAVNLAQNASGTALPANAITTVTNGALLLRTIANENSCTGLPDTGYTEQLDSNYLKTNTKIQTTAGTDTPAGGSFSASTLKLGALIAFRPAAAGGTTVNGVLATSSSLTGTIAGKRTVKGTAAGSSTLSAVVSGVRRVLAAVVGTSSLTATVAGSRTVRSTLATGSAVTATTAGQRTVFGVVDGASQLAAAAGGRRTVIGSASAGSSLAATGSGSHGVQGVAQSGFQLSAGMTGQRTVLAALGGSSALIATVSGVVTSAGTGVAQSDSSLSASMTGTRSVTGTASASSALTATLNGDVESGAVTVTGTASAASSLTAMTAGSRTVAGLLSADFALVALMLSPPPIIGDVPTEGLLTLGDLMDARATQESIMLDTIGARHPGMIEGVFDPDLGYAPSTPKDEYYHGKATVQARQITAGDIQPAGGLGTLTQLGYAVKAPVGTAIDQAAPGDFIVVYDSADPRHNGLQLIVRNVESNTFVTARRMICVLYEPSTP